MKRAVVACAAGAVLLALICVWSREQARLRGFAYDDTFITLRYAENLVRHHRLSFNADDRVDGYTSPGWTVWLAGAIALGADGERAAGALSWGCGLGAALAAAAFARRLGAKLVSAVGVAALGTITSAGFAVWSAPGMETPYVALCAVLALAAFAGPPCDGVAPRVFSSVALVLCATSRPEGALLAALLLGLDCLRRRAVPVEHALVATLLLALFAWHWVYYGYPLPNTYYAKVPSLRATPRSIADLKGFLGSRGLFLAPLGALALARRRSRVALLSFSVWFAATLFTYCMAGGDYLAFHRFYQPLLPASLAVIAAAISLFPWRRLGLPVSVAATVALALGDQKELDRALDDPTLYSATNFLRVWRSVGEGLRAEFPPSTSMAIRAAGIVPYLTRFRTFDTLGLSNQEIAHHAGVVHPDYVGHTKEASPAQVVAWRPDLVLGHPIVRARDISGDPLAWLDPPELVAAGYRHRCIRLPALPGGGYLCFWQRD